MDSQGERPAPHVLPEAPSADRHAKLGGSRGSLAQSPAAEEPRKKSIRALPIGGRDTASSRIRCYGFLENLPSDEFVIGMLTDVTTEADIDFDVLYVQKTAYAGIVELARHALRLGIKVVYDLDEEIGVYSGMHEEEICRIATAVTVDTEQRAAVIRELTDKPVHVVPDCLDYVTGRLPRAPLRQALAHVVTFGNVESLSATRPFMACVPPGVERTYIGHPAGQIADCRHVEWRLDSFTSDLAQYDACLLAHDAESGTLKSNNRLLVAMSVGLPTIVSNTPAYAETVRAIGYPGLIVANPREVPEALKRIGDATLRLEISEAGIRHAWDNYAPERISALFAEVLRAL